MNSVGDDIGGKPRVREYFADNSRFTVVQWPHRIKRMGGMPRAGSHGGARRIHITIGMSQADADPPSRGLRDHLPCAFQFGRNGHDANVPTSRLPEAVEGWQGRRQQVRGRMRAAANVTEERALKMDAKGLGSFRVRAIVP